MVCKNGGTLSTTYSVSTRTLKPTVQNTLLPRLHQQVLEIQQRLFRRAHVHKRRRDARFATPPRTPNLVHIVLDLFWHGKDDDVLNVVEVEPFGGDARRNHDVLGAGFERLDGILTFFLTYGIERVRRA